MGRVLMMQTVDIEDADRNAILEASRARRDICRTLGCNFWLFEEKDAGRFIQFLEAPDRKTLLNALVAVAPGRELSSILHEVELL